MNRRTRKEERFLSIYLPIMSNPCWGPRHYQIVSHLNTKTPLLRAKMLEENITIIFTCLGADTLRQKS